MSTLSLAVEDWDPDEVECPDCGEPFDRDEWPDAGGFCTARSGGYTEWDCPVGGCPGSAELLI